MRKIPALLLLLLLLNSPVLADKEIIVLTGEGLTVEAVVKIARDEADIGMSTEGWNRLEAARDVVDHYVEKDIPAYGFTTMFGQDFDVVLPQAQIAQFNRINVIQEATRMGDGSRRPLERGVARAAWALLINSYARGFSGVSRELTEKMIERVNSNRLPEDIEIGGSMGDADLTMNCQLALSLYDDPGFKLGAGEAMTLMTHNFISVARAALVLHEARHLLERSKVALALNMEGYRANPSPIPPAAVTSTVYPAKRAVQQDLQRLLAGSRLWEDKGPRRLQDFLSMRDASDVLAAAQQSVEDAETVLELAMNAHQGSPMVDVDSGRLLTVTNFDTTQLTLKMDACRLSLALLSTTSVNRSLKAISRPFTDLPSGFATDKDGFNGLYTRNITYWLASLDREARLYGTPVVLDAVSYVAEGDEDYSTPLPDTVGLAEELLDRLEKIVTLEALVGSYAVDRRIESGELKIEDLPKPLRSTFQNVMARSPKSLQLDEQYTLEPLLKDFLGERR